MKISFETKYSTLFINMLLVISFEVVDLSTYNNNRGICKKRKTNLIDIL